MIVAKHNHADLERLAQLLVDGELTRSSTPPTRSRSAMRHVVAETPAENSSSPDLRGLHSGDLHSACRVAQGLCRTEPWYARKAGLRRTRDPPANAAGGRSEPPSLVVTAFRGGCSEKPLRVARAGGQARARRSRSVGIDISQDTSEASAAWARVDGLCPTWDREGLTAAPRTDIRMSARVPR
jgi:hypothetical protein